MIDAGIDRSKHRCCNATELIFIGAVTNNSLDLHVRLLVLRGDDQLELGIFDVMHASAHPVGRRLQVELELI
jgi:hypothetical protein